MQKVTEKPELNRREILNLAWLASLGIFIIPVGGVTILFAFPRFKKGEFGGRFVLDRIREVFPAPDGEPGSDFTGKFWLPRLADGSLLALYKVCTHLGCLYNWHRQEHKFICPCHGSQLQLDGTYLEGIAPRSLDRFVKLVVDQDKNEVSSTNEEGDAVNVFDENWFVVVDTGKLIQGKYREQSCLTSK